MKDIMPSAVTISIFALLFTSMVFQSVFAYEKKHDHEISPSAFAPSPSVEPFWKDLLKKHKLPAFAPTPSESLPSIFEKHFLKAFAPSPSKSLPEIIADHFHKNFAPSPSESKHDGEKKKFFGLPPFPKFGLKKDHDKFFKSLYPLPSFSSLSPSASAELEGKKHHFAAASPASSPTGTYKPHFKVVSNTDSVDKAAKAPTASPKVIYVVPVPEEAAKPKKMGRKLM